MFWVAIGVGLGIGAVHAAVIFVVMALVRKSATTQANESIELMRERNELDTQKVAALNWIAESITASSSW